MKKLTIGILAHVDAGKTTLSEGLLYAAGALRTLGRVDHGDAFLDTEALERERGITIFAKQAVLDCGGTHITLLDTPGHVDFSAEAERTLQVLDYAILVISGTDGVQGHTRTLWRLLERYGVSVDPALLTPGETLFELGFLRLTDQGKYVFHLIFRSPLVPCKLSLDMSLGKFLFQTVTYFVSLTLAFVHIVTQCFFTFAVASLTSAVYHRQRALNMMIAEFHTTFALIRHVAICT
mgnify:CR=1 FL=1